MTHIIYTPIYMNQKGKMRRGREKKEIKSRDIAVARKETKERLLIIHFLGCLTRYR